MEGGEQLPSRESSQVICFFQAGMDLEDRPWDDLDAEDSPGSNATDADAALDADSDEWCVISDKD